MAPDAPIVGIVEDGSINTLRRKNPPMWKDADDVAHPERLAREWAVLRDRPDVALVGTLAEGIDGEGRLVRPRDRSVLFRRSPVPPFPHGTIMFRQAAFLEVGGYRHLEVGEDLDLCRRLARRGRVAVLVDALYRYRYHAGSATRGLLADVSGPGLDQMAAVLSPPPGAASRPVARRRALYYAAASSLWAGERPGMAPLRAVAANGPLTAGGVKVGLLTGAALVSPRVTRAILGLGIRARDRLAGWRLGGRRTVDWEPPGDA